MEQELVETAIPVQNKAVSVRWNRRLVKCGVCTSIAVTLVLALTAPGCIRSVSQILPQIALLPTVSASEGPRLMTTISDDEISTEDEEPVSPEEVQNIVKNWPGRIFALGDLHGDLQNTMMLLISAGVIEQSGNWIAGDALLVQTGDIVDRGPYSKPLYSLFQHLGLQARKANGRIVHLLGNHEALIVCGMYNYLHPFELHQYYHGSYQVLAKEWSASGGIGTFLRTNFHVNLVVNGIMFVHAGMLPVHASIPSEELRRQFWEHVDSYSCGSPPPEKGWDLLGDGGPLWTRLLVELPEEHACALLRRTLKHSGAVRMVVGHTPTLSKSIETRCENRLVMIDTGLSRFLFDRPTLLEIHNGTFTQHYHTTEGSLLATNSTSHVVTNKKVLFFEESNEAHVEWLSQDDRELDLLHPSAAIIPVDPQYEDQLPEDPFDSDEVDFDIKDPDRNIHDEL
eukprot:Selendium_serpulae@DN6208_c0_g1_i1.p1